MSHLVPSEFVTKMVDAGESKIYMATRDSLIRAYMAGAILAWLLFCSHRFSSNRLTDCWCDSFPVGFYALPHGF